MALAFGVLVVVESLVRTNKTRHGTVPNDGDQQNFDYAHHEAQCQMPTTSYRLLCILPVETCSMLHLQIQYLRPRHQAVVQIRHN